MLQGTGAARPWALAMLCNVDACVVVYDGRGELQPEVWPNMPKAAQVLACFKAMPELDQCKKMMDMDDFLNQCNDKLKEQLHKAQLNPVAVAASGHNQI
jgi:hypothetical protein